MKQFIVWGIPPNSKQENILFTKAKTEMHAKQICKILENSQGCKNCRVQVLDGLTPPDFRKAINI
jgi:hypothetical protein